jgi:hypothetical protein
MTVPDFPRPRFPTRTTTIKLEAIDRHLLFQEKSKRNHSHGWQQSFHK